MTAETITIDNRDVVILYWNSNPSDAEKIIMAWEKGCGEKLNSGNWNTKFCGAVNSKGNTNYCYKCKKMIKELNEKFEKEN